MRTLSRPVTRVKSTTTLFDASTGHCARTPHTFGRGILASMPHAGRMPYTAADRAEMAQPAAILDNGPMACAAWENEAWDAMAADAMAQDRLEAGLDASQPARRTVTGEPTADPAAPLYSATSDVRNLIRCFGW